MGKAWLGVKVSARFGYEGQTAHIVTKHGKAELLAPVLLKRLGMNLVAVEADTDQFGTFAGEIERSFSPLDTAIRKANLATECASASLCLASEGTIGPDPSFPLLTADIETLVFIDLSLDISIHATYVSREIYSFRSVLTSTQDTDALIGKLDLTNQAMIVKSSEMQPKFVAKGLTSIEAINNAVRIALPEFGQVIIEPDYRAMFSASRRKNIIACAEKLADKILSRCPICELPGWSGNSSQEGKTCSSCGENETTVSRASVFSCQQCNHRETIDEPDSFCDPKYCLSCNP